jgi:hypothetical protein
MFKLWLVDTNGNLRNAGKIYCPDADIAEEEAYRRARYMSAVFGIDIINVICQRVETVS